MMKNIYFEQVTGKGLDTLCWIVNKGYHIFAAPWKGGWCTYCCKWVWCFTHKWGKYPCPGLLGLWRLSCIKRELLPPFNAAAVAVPAVPMRTSVRSRSEFSGMPRSRRGLEWDQEKHSALPSHTPAYWAIWEGVLLLRHNPSRICNPSIPMNSTSPWLNAFVYPWTWMSVWSNFLI